MYSDPGSNHAFFDNVFELGKNYVKSIALPKERFYHHLGEGPSCPILLMCKVSTLDNYICHSYVFPLGYLCILFEILYWWIDFIV